MCVSPRHGGMQKAGSECDSILSFVPFSTYLETIVFCLLLKVDKVSHFFSKVYTSSLEMNVWNVCCLL